MFGHECCFFACVAPVAFQTNVFEPPPPSSFCLHVEPWKKGPRGKHIGTKGARGMHIGKRCPCHCDCKKRSPCHRYWRKGARVAAITPPGPRFEKLPVVGVLGAGPQYARHGHLLRNRSHTGTFCRFCPFHNVHTTGTFFESAYHGHLFPIRLPRAPFEKVPGVSVLRKRCPW